MQIIRNLKVPTGNIVVGQGSKGPLEFLSIADYGKDVNLNQDKPVVDGTPLLPLEEKWVITISTQYGCSMGCTFCDVPKVGPGINATYEDLRDQVLGGLALYPEITSTKRLNVHFARMGEPTWNPAVLEFIVDCVMAGMARSGNVYELEMAEGVLERAFKNTVEMLKREVVVEREENL